MTDDAGRGLDCRSGWLVTSVNGSHLRWLSPWLQSVLCDIWNCSFILMRWLAPGKVYGFLPVRIYYIGAIAFTIVWLLLAKHLPSVGGS